MSLFALMSETLKKPHTCWNLLSFWGRRRSLAFLTIGTSLLIWGCNTSNSLPPEPTMPENASSPTVGSPSEESNSSSGESTEQTQTKEIIEGKVAPSPNDLCAEIAAADAQQPITLSNLQFHRPIPIPFEFDEEIDADHLIGCITNNAEQPINGVELTLTFEVEGGSGFAVAMVEFPGESIAPGQTVPFKHSSELDFDTTEVTVKKAVTLEPMTGYEEYAFQAVDEFETQQTVVYVPAKSPPGESVDAFCEGAAAAKTDQLLEVNRVEIYTLPRDPYDFREEQEVALVGCVTNHSDEPIEGLGMSFSTNESNFAVASVLIPGDAIQPGQTVPFRKFGELSEDTKLFTIHSMNSVEMNISVNR